MAVFALQTSYSTLHTSHSTLCTWRSTLYTLHSAPYICAIHLHPTLYTLHCALHTRHTTLHSALYTLHSTICTLHSALRTPHFTLDTPHSTPYISTLYTLHVTVPLNTWHSHSTLYTRHAPCVTRLHTLHSTLYAPHFALHILHFTLNTSYSTLHTLDFALCTLHFSHHALHLTLRTLPFTLRTLHLILYTFHFALYIPHSELYTLHSTLYTRHFTLHNPHFTQSSHSTLCTPLHFNTGTVTVEECTKLWKIATFIHLHNFITPAAGCTCYQLFCAWFEFGWTLTALILLLLFFFATFATLWFTVTLFLWFGNAHKVTRSHETSAILPSQLHNEANTWRRRIHVESSRPGQIFWARFQLMVCVHPPRRRTMLMPQTIHSFCLDSLRPAATRIMGNRVATLEFPTACVVTMSMVMRSNERLVWVWHPLTKKSKKPLACNEN